MKKVKFIVICKAKDLKNEIKKVADQSQLPKHNKTLFFAK